MRGRHSHFIIPAAFAAAILAFIAGAAAAPNGDMRAAQTPAAGQAANSKADAPNNSLAAAETRSRGVLNGYKGYRHHRPGYKTGGDGWWYPRAAFGQNSRARFFMQKPKKALPPDARRAAEKTDKKTDAQKRRRAAGLALTPAHENWCAAHYPGYNARDNSYATPQGGRKVCLSPNLR